jgi:hypothetical protein
MILDDRISAIASLPKVFDCPFGRPNYNKRRNMTYEKCDISRIYYKFDKSLNGLGRGGLEPNVCVILFNFSRHEENFLGGGSSNFHASLLVMLQ